ncbi:MAG TPA: protease modulator HflC [Patescibacteria group bacterium]|nr:protease modulator HflC [Patescibacteria group bacterium]
MKRPVRLAAVIGAASVLWLLNASLYIVGEGQEALVVRLGKPMGLAGDPGLKAKMPLVDTVNYYETRLLLLEPPAEQVILGDQKRLEVQTYTRFRISDPLRFYQSVRTVEQARAQLTQLVSSSLRRELGQVMLRALLSDERTRIVNDIQKEVAEKALPLGIEVVEVRIHRADLPYETSQAIYDRMKSEREREAKELRAQGFEWAQAIQAKADRERTVILSEAQRQATITRGAAEAQANQLFADAFGKDPQFYKLYRSLQTYRQALAGSGPTLVLSPDAEFLTDFKAGPGAAGRR